MLESPRKSLAHVTQTIFWSLTVAIAYSLSLGTAIAQNDQATDKQTNQAAAATSEDALNFYRSDVLPILQEHCLKCHSHAAQKASGGLVLDSRSAILKGGDSGPAATLDQVDASLLIRAVSYSMESLQMPPDGKLSDEQIEVLKQWIAKGLPAPETGLEQTKKTKVIDPKEHWAYRPIQKPSRPDDVHNGSEAIDYWVQQSREKAGVTVVAPASPRTLIYRLYLDLLGLPPTPEQLDQLVDQVEVGTETIPKIVDRLLNMQEFGERWGRHWLDVARYADSNGCSIESNNTYDNAWRYRDYVIQSFNGDKPYDQFVVEQIAGDLLDYVSTTQRCDQLIATGFLLLGPKAFGTDNFEQFRLDVIDEQIDTIGKAMLGVSFGCARCHDHKFDPVPTADYYALVGIMASTESVRSAKGWRQGRSWFNVKLPVLDPEAEAALEAIYAQNVKDAASGDLKKRVEEKVKEAEAALAMLRESTPDKKDEISKAEQAVKTAKFELKNAGKMAKVLPVMSPVPIAMAVAEKKEPVNEAIRIRGVPDNRGEKVTRHVPTVLGDATLEPFAVPKQQSGRLQLARWMVNDTDGAGSLLARVAVNRVWGHLFSQPLSITPDNLGMSGEAPSHPELLDDLARRFIDSGWSMKTIIRDIVLSKTYQLAAVDHPENAAIDPNNVWLWRYQPKRLDIEVLRDSMLAITNQLDRTRGGKTLQHQGLITIGEDHIDLSSPSPYKRRTVYIPIIRDAVGISAEIDSSMGMLGTFDFADPNLMAGGRSRTTVPGQALFLMNAEFIYEQSTRLAEALLSDPDLKSDEQRVERTVALVFGRHATADEVARLTRFVNPRAATTENEEVAEGETATREKWIMLCQALFGSNEFLFQD